MCLDGTCIAAGAQAFILACLSLSLSLVDNPVATARASFLRGQGRYTGPDPSRELPLGGGAARVPAGGVSEVSRMFEAHDVVDCGRCLLAGVGGETGLGGRGMIPRSVWRWCVPLRKRK